MTTSNRPARVPADWDMTDPAVIAAADQMGALVGDYDESARRSREVCIVWCGRCRCTVSRGYGPDASWHLDSIT